MTVLFEPTPAGGTLLLELDPCEETLSPLNAPLVRTLGDQLVATGYRPAHLPIPLRIVLRGTVDDGQPLMALLRRSQRPFTLQLTTRLWQVGDADRTAHQPRVKAQLVDWHLTTDPLTQAATYRLTFETVTEA